MTVRQMVDEFAKRLDEFREKNLEFVEVEDAFLEAFHNCAMDLSVRFVSVDDSEHFSDDVREALGHERVCTTVFWVSK